MFKWLEDEVMFFYQRNRNISFRFLYMALLICLRRRENL